MFVAVDMVVKAGPEFFPVCSTVGLLSMTALGIVSMLGEGKPPVFLCVVALIEVSDGEHAP